jgi:uncharacterized protein (TIGR00375 family)
VNEMKSYFADLHIHIGRTNSGKPVKITGAKNLTIENIFHEASTNKGMDIIGVIDCHVPEVLHKLEKDLLTGKYREHPDGGIRYKKTTLFLGSELEIFDEDCQGPIHVLAFMSHLEKMRKFSEWLRPFVKNIHLSSQRIYVRARALQEKIKELNGLFIPAHIFTPHKSLYGKGVNKSLTEVFNPNLIDALELGLSSDTEMASQLKELENYPFLTNSDAHSLSKIGREYQRLYLKEPTFNEFQLALMKKNGRHIIANFGLNPKLGKYYETYCESCGKQVGFTTKDGCCPICGTKKVIKGVKDRLLELADRNHPIQNRPPYVHQIPLEMIPGIGKQTLAKLKKHFGTEMNILHNVPFETLCKVVPEKIAYFIMASREGKLQVKAGGGGVYGRVTDN